MIIAVEGNVHVGKTTYCKNFVKDNPEYEIVTECLFDPTRTPYQTQLYYLEQEKNKKLTCKSNNLIMDRSIVSTFIYTTFTDTLSNDQKQDIVDKIKTMISQQELILPQKIVFLVTDAWLVEQRQQTLGQQKGTQSILGTLDYYNYYNEFFMRHNPELIKKDGQNLIYQLDGEMVLKTIKEYHL
jgi:deoxyadenosine/deoxycytidine kinase